jgi:lia operon protein LiaG
MFGKNTLTRVVVITAIVAAAALAIATIIGFAAGGFVPRQFGRAGVMVDERKSLDLQGIDLISVTFVSGKTRVVEGAGSSVEAWVHGTIGTGNPDAVPHLVVERAGSAVNINFERTQPLSMGFFWSNLELEVSVPSGYGKRLAVKTVSADVEIADHAYTGLDLSTTSGDVKVGAVSAANVSLRTTSGDLRATRLTAQRIEISSVSGDVVVGSMTGDASLAIDAESTSGDVTISLPANAQFELDARSTSGRLTCEFPITIKENRSGGGSHVLSGTVGTGGSPVTVRTVSGDIKIAR